MNKASSLAKLVVGLSFLGLLGLGGGVFYREWRSDKLQSPSAPTPIAITELESKTAETSAPTVETVQSLPTQLNIDVPFFTQAPNSNWDYPWQEACEEASVATVANLYLNKNWNKDEFNTQLLNLVDWETKNFGTYMDTTLAQTAEFMKTNYGLDSIVHENPTYEDIQKILTSGHLIIAPFAGKLLGNPNFKNGGPLYHNLVIKGYDATKNQIVTNDVGTRNGADYVYSWSILQNALHDWNAEDITQGSKRILEVLPLAP